MSSLTINYVRENIIRLGIQMLELWIPMEKKSRVCVSFPTEFTLPGAEFGDRSGCNN